MKQMENDKIVDLGDDGGDDANSTPKKIIIPTSRVREGLTDEEQRDPNAIMVSITDPSPLVILFGAGASGKTMTLIRLTQWLRKNNYKVEPDRNFRPSNSSYYKQKCDEFDALVSSQYAAPRNTVYDFMLVKVMDQYGQPICQILEAPGEHYYDTDHPNEPFPAYINKITQVDNPRTWMFVVEIDWKDAQDRQNYAQKIMNMQNQMSHNDRVIFTFHKADKQKALFSGGVANEKQYFKNVANQYPGIFSRYKNENPITKHFREYNFDYVIFSAGLFSPTVDGGLTYTPSNDEYPQKLWKSILKTVRGGVF